MFISNNKIVFLIIFLIFTNSLVFSEVSISKVYLEPSLPYVDSKDLNLVFEIDNLTINEEYVLKIDVSDKYLLQDNKFCSFNDCILYVNDKNYIFVANDTSGTIKYHLSLKEDIKKSEDIYTHYDLKESGFSVIGGEKLFQKNFEENPLSFGLSAVNSSGESPSEGFGKTDTITLKLIDLKDNIDDKGGKQVKCSYNLKKGSEQKDSNSNIVYDNISLDNPYSTNIKSYNADSLGPGNYTFTMVCNDNGSEGLEYEVTKEFSIVDLKPDINAISFTPSEVYPDSKIKCNATAKDADDPTATFTYTYEWFKNGTKLDVSGDQLDCASASCKSGDEIKCVVKATDTQESDPKEIKTKVKSYFESVKISGKSRVQKDEEVKFTASVKYNGTGTVSYKWSFGDGDTAEGKSVSHKYTEKGDFTVKLEVDDGKGSTGFETETITVVDPDLVIDIKSPTLNQDVERGESINVKAQITDNTSTPINNAKVFARFKFGDENTAWTELTRVEKSAGMYEAELKVPYYMLTESEVEVKASYEKAGINLSSLKSVAINSNPVVLTPKIIIDTKYTESDDKLTAGNTLTKVTVCFAFPSGSFDNKMQNSLKLVLNDEEFSLTKENKCYVSYASYQLPSDLSELEIKFKNAKDIYKNYVKASFKKVYDVKPAPDLFGFVLLKPQAKGTLGFPLKVVAKITKKENFSELKDLKVFVKYKSKEFALEKCQETDSEITFCGSFLPDKESEVSFSVVANGFYKDMIVLKEVKKKITLTNELNLELVSPNSEGKVSEEDKLIISVSDAEHTLLDVNEITLKVNDKNITFKKDANGYYFADYDLPYGESLSLKFAGKLKDIDVQKNINLDYVGAPNFKIKLLLFLINFWIYFAILVALVLILLIVKKSLKKMKKELKAGKSLEELEEEKATIEAILRELPQKYMHREISETEFKAQQLEYQKKLDVINAKIKQLKMKEVFNESSDDTASDLEIPAEERQKLDLLLENYIHTKEDLDTYVAKLKSLNKEDKYIEYLVRKYFEKQKKS